MRKFLFTLFKIIIGVAAAANLIALFVFQYDIPVELKLPALPFGHFRETEVTVERTTEAEGPAEGQDADSADGNGDASQPSSGTPAEEDGPSIRIEVPSSPINYNGSGDLDLMTGVYVLNADGTAATGIDVTTEISEGTSRREKTITYSAKAPGGETITATRNLYLGSRYTGPTINILQALPYCLEGEAEQYAGKLVGDGIVSAENGFNRDITKQVTSKLKSYNAGREEATITLSVVNEFKDTFSTDVSVSMNATGVILKLTEDHVTLQVGDYFTSYNYLKECHDAEGKDLKERVVREGEVDTSTPGEYTCEVYCTDENGTMSKRQTLVVTVVEPEPDSETEQDG